MTGPSQTLLPALALLAAIASPACAQPTPPAPSAEQAAALERQVHDWLAGLTGGVVALPDRPVQFTPDGDGYRITAPLAGLGVEPTDAALTARAHMLDATRWAIDDEQLPPTLKVTTHQRFPDAPGAATRAIPGPRPGPTHLDTVVYEFRFGQQNVTGVFDPTYATPGNTQGSMASLDMVQTGGPAATIAHIGPTTSTSTVTPAGGGRIDLLVDNTSQTYETKTEFPDGSSLTMTMERMHIEGGVTGFAREKLAPLIRTMVLAAQSGQAGAAAPGAKPPAKAPPPAPGDNAARGKAMARAILTEATGLLTGVSGEQTADGMAFDFSGHSGTIKHLAVSFAANAPQDMLTASVGLTMDGLGIAELPPALAAYVPTHFAIHPTVSNLNVAALTKIGMDASAPERKAKPGPADFAALFQNGGINLGFDTLGLDIGDTKFSGTGSFNMTGPQTIAGQAEITARGLDALISKVQADPMMRQAMPMIIFLKGIARVNADQAVWQVSVANGKALVNGVDLGAMAAAMNR